MSVKVTTIIQIDYKFQFVVCLNTAILWNKWQLLLNTGPRLSRHKSHALLALSEVNHFVTPLTTLPTLKVSRPTWPWLCPRLDQLTCKPNMFDVYNLDVIILYYFLGKSRPVTMDKFCLKQRFSWVWFDKTLLWE